MNGLIEPARGLSVSHGSGFLFVGVRREPLRGLVALTPEDARRLGFELIMQSHMAREDTEIDDVVTARRA